jgi:glucokinase
MSGAASAGRAGDDLAAKEPPLAVERPERRIAVEHHYQLLVREMGVEREGGGAGWELEQGRPQAVGSRLAPKPRSPPAEAPLVALGVEIGLERVRHESESGSPASWGRPGRRRAAAPSAANPRAFDVLPDNAAKGRTRGVNGVRHGGRPGSVVSMRGGIDLGGTKIQAVVVDDAGAVEGEQRLPTPTSGGPPDVAGAMADALRAAAAQAGVDSAELAGVGVGSPGIVDSRKGIVSSARNLPDWEGSFPLAGTLADLLGTRVKIENDVQVATDAEFKLGAGRPYRSLLGVFWGTGVGGGIILKGKPWLGRGGAGEIGHIVVKIGGARCPCGRRGCMEAYAGRKALEERARKRVEKGAKTDLFKIMEKRGRDRLTSGVWARALEHDDKLAHKLLDEAVEALGAGVASALNVLDVEAVIVGGGLGLRLGEPYCRRIEKAIMPHLFASDDPPAIHMAELGDLGGAIGASLLIRPRAAARVQTVASG